jgi:hypothetical protein
VTPEPELGDTQRWRTLLAGEEARAKFLAEACDALDPQRRESYRTSAIRSVADFPRMPANATEEDGLRWAAEWMRAQADYLEGRYEQLRERATFRERLAEDGRRGFRRLAPGLDGDLDVVREQIRSAGGLTHQHRVELGRIKEEN